MGSERTFDRILVLIYNFKRKKSNRPATEENTLNLKKGFTRRGGKRERHLHKIFPKMGEKCGPNQPSVSVLLSRRWSSGRRSKTGREAGGWEGGSGVRLRDDPRSAREVTQEHVGQRAGVRLREALFSRRGLRAHWRGTARGAPLKQRSTGVRQRLPQTCAQKAMNLTEEQGRLSHRHPVFSEGKGERQAAKFPSVGDRKARRVVWGRPVLRGTPGGHGAMRWQRRGTDARSRRPRARRLGSGAESTTGACLRPCACKFQVGWDARTLSTHLPLAPAACPRGESKRPPRLPPGLTRDHRMSTADSWGHRPHPLVPWTRLGGDHTVRAGPAVRGHSTPWSAVPTEARFPAASTPAPAARPVAGGVPVRAAGSAL